MQCKTLTAQGSLSLQCAALHIDKTMPLIYQDPTINEDDPNDLDEAYGDIVAFLGENSDDHFSLSFPTKIKSWHWTQKDEYDKNDSLSAYLVYNINPKQNGQVLQAYPKDFTITVTRYENKKGGIIEGTFQGTMQADVAWLHQTATITVKGNFKTTRSGEAPFNVRKQRLSEKPVITNAVKILENVLLQPLQNAGWQITGKNNALNAPVSNRSDLAITINMLTLKLALDPNSTYGKMMLDSAKYYNEQLSKNTLGSEGYKQAAKKFFRLQNILTAEICISSNLFYLKQSSYTIESKDKYSVLHIPGASYACRVYKAPADETSNPEEYTQLFFGNWKGADMHSSAVVKYPFIHKTGPYIENFVVTITAPAATADKIIQSIDWNKLNDAIHK